jgi:hypothetical protein
MKWLAAIMMATEIASAAVGVAACAQTAPALTPQQKQELSTYNFKGAEAALETQDIQPASKPSALTPIPPLKVPPITSRSLPAQSSPAGAPADKGSEVPLNWRPPHAELNAAAVSAAEVSRQWETGVATPTSGADGKVVYIFGQGMPVIGLRSAAGLRNRACRLASISKANPRLAIPAAGRLPLSSPAPASMKRRC